MTAPPDLPTRPVWGAAGWLRFGATGALVLTVSPDTHPAACDARHHLGWSGTAGGTVAAPRAVAAAFAYMHGFAVDPTIVANLPGRRTRPSGPITIPGWGTEITLTDAQLAAAAQLAEWGGGFLADDVGLGKTFTALAAASAHGADRVVVVVKADLKLNWVNETVRAYGCDPSEVLAATSRTPNGITDTTRVVIINPEIFPHWVDTLTRWVPGALLVDESHFLANPDTKRSQAALQLAATVRASNGIVIAMSASLPPGGDVAQMWPTLMLLDHTDRYATNRDEFIERFAAGEYKWGEMTATPLDDADRGLEARGGLAGLSALLSDQTMVRRSKRVALPDLDDPVYHRIRLGTDPELSKQLGLADTDLEAWLAEHSTRTASWARGVAKGDYAALVRYAACGQLAAAPKLAAAVEWLTQFLDEHPEDKIIVFALHRAIQGALLGRPLASKKADDTEALLDWDAPELADALEAGARLAAETNAASILSNTDQKPAVTETEKHRFQTDPNCRLIVCSISAAAEGHTLTAARHVVFLQPPETPAKLRQCVGRCWGRLNDPHGADVWFTVGRHLNDAGEPIDSFDDRRLRKVATNDRALAAVLDG